MAIVKSNPSLHRLLPSFQPRKRWIQSIYCRYSFTRRAGTTSRPLVPKGLYEECKLTFLRDKFSWPVQNPLHTSSQCRPNTKLLCVCGKNDKLWQNEMPSLSQSRGQLINRVSHSLLQYLWLVISYQCKSSAWERQSSVSLITLVFPRVFAWHKTLSITQTKWKWLRSSTRSSTLTWYRNTILIWDVFKDQKTPFFEHRSCLCSRKYDKLVSTTWLDC